MSSISEMTGRRQINWNDSEPDSSIDEDVVATRFPSINDLSSIMPKYSLEFDQAVPNYPADLKDLIFQYAVGTFNDLFCEAKHLIHRCVPGFYYAGRNSVSPSPYRSAPKPGEAWNLANRFASAAENHGCLSLKTGRFRTRAAFKERTYSQISQYVFQRDHKKESNELDRILDISKQQSLMVERDRGLLVCFGFDHRLRNEGMVTLKSDLAKLPLLELSDQAESVYQKIKKKFQAIPFPYRRR